MLSARLAASFIAVVLSVPAWSATLAVFPLSSDLDPSFLDPNITASLNPSSLFSYTFGSDGFGSVFQAYPDASTDTLALADNQYFTLSLETSSGAFSTLQFDFLVGKGGSSDPRGYFVRSSLDGFSTDLIAGVLPNGAPAPANFTLDATGLSTVDLRFYVYTPSTGNSVDFSTLEVSDGQAGEGVPEPTTWGLVATGLLSAAYLRRRKSVHAPVRLS